MAQQTPTDRELIVQMRERITAARCIDCDKPVFSMAAWRCDGCAYEYHRAVRDEESPCSPPDDDAEDD